MGRAASDASRLADMAESISSDALSIAALVSPAADSTDRSPTGAALAKLAVESLASVSTRMSSVEILEELARQADAESERGGEL